MFGRRLAIAGVTALVMAGMGGCSGSDAGAHTGGGDHVSTVNGGTTPSPDTVYGLRDEVRHVSAVTTRATRPHLVRQCTDATRRVKHTRRTGSGKRRSTRNRYTTEHYQRCGKVRHGTETYRRVTRPEHWCVRLDDVGGDRSHDDVWYRVTRTTYGDALGTHDHARLRFTPRGSGC
ncbi:hypothetical protein [Streptomyces sp. NBC_00566]|uniref:hypothetical protein n=1 Tax=Streptomyces sp. NBC_00566 TaxID=2975778 RepID=UPI002E8060F9|nr:hypothetical protein [Streptomyces sp. NBC_00566]WUB85180.1 hypothetical protein OG812_00505 [Streptomyces sp. NBC_00566]